MEDKLYTTKEVSNILKIDQKEVAKLCKNNKLWGCKTPGYFGKWLIPNRSIELYLYYRKGGKTNRMENNVMESYDGRYNAKILKNILGEDFNAFMRYLYKDRIRILCFMLRRSFEATIIFPFLHANQDVLNRLKERHGDMLATGSVYEPTVRHLLMLYMYWSEYGYIPN